MTPLLQFAQTTDQAASAMLALVAVDQNRVITTIEKYSQGSTDLVLRNYSYRDGVREKVLAFKHQRVFSGVAWCCIGASVFFFFFCVQGYLL